MRILNDPEGAQPLSELEMSENTLELGIGYRRPRALPRKVDKVYPSLPPSILNSSLRPRRTLLELGPPSLLPFRQEKQELPL